MNFSGIFARIVALIGAAALLWRRLQGTAPEPAWGSAPEVPVAKPQGAIPTLKLPTARGWSDGQLSGAASGHKENANAANLQNPLSSYEPPERGRLSRMLTLLAGSPRTAV